MLENSFVKERVNLHGKPYRCLILRSCQGNPDLRQHHLDQAAAINTKARLSTSEKIQTCWRLRWWSSRLWQFLKAGRVLCLAGLLQCAALNFIPSHLHWFAFLQAVPIKLLGLAAEDEVKCKPRLWWSSFSPTSPRIDLGSLPQSEGCPSVTRLCCLGKTRRRYSWAGSLFSPRTHSGTVWGTAGFYSHMDSAL